MTGGVPFVYISTCGCVFSQSGLRSISSSPAEGEKDVCPQCSTKFSRSTDIVPINSSPEEQLEMRHALEARRALEAATKPKKSKKRKAEECALATDSEPAPKRSATTDGKSRPVAAPYTNSAAATSRAVATALAAEEQKRKVLMSDAVKSLYSPKDGSMKKETFMTRGTFTRVSSHLLKLVHD